MATVLYVPVEGNLLNFISDRLETWQHLLQTHIKCFTALLELEEQTKTVYQRMSSFLPATPIMETNEKKDGATEPPVTWLGPLQWLITKGRSNEEAFVTFLRVDGLPLLERLLKEHVQRGRGKAIKGHLAEAQTKVARCHGTMLETIKTHELGWAHRLCLYTASSAAEEGKELSEALQASDLFLSEQQMRHAAARFLTEKEDFIQVLQEQFRALQELELDLTDELRPLLVNLLRGKEQQVGPTAAESITELINTIRGLDASQEWRMAQRKHRLDWDWSLAVPPVDGLVASILTQVGLSLAPEATSPMIRPIRIMKSGYLMRPPASAFSRSWSVIFCILCDSAFLHCYQPEALRQQRQQFQENLRVPSSSMNLHRRGLAELNGTAARLWLPDSPEGQVPGMPALLSHPLLSIPLLHPGTIISPEASRSGDKHIFTVTIPGSSSLFGRSERKYQLRSFVEEDMVDWCIAIKETMALVQSFHCQPVVFRKEQAVGGEDIQSTAPGEEPALTKARELTEISTTISPIHSSHYPHQAELEEGYLGSTPPPTTPIDEVENPWE